MIFKEIFLTFIKNIKVKNNIITSSLNMTMLTNIVLTEELLNTLTSSCAVPGHLENEFVSPWQTDPAFF